MSEPFLAEIRIFAGSFAPRSWAFCDGQLLPINQNQALFSLVGTTYGGDGRTTFGLPDLRGRVPVHPGSGPGLTTRRVGDKGGSEAQTLNVNQLPAHNHGVRVQSDDGDSDEPKGNYLAKAGGGETIYASTQNETMNSGMVEKTGEGQAVEVMQPYLCINFIIALQGIFPSRP